MLEGSAILLMSLKMLAANNRRRAVNDKWKFSMKVGEEWGDLSTNVIERGFVLKQY